MKASCSIAMQPGSGRLGNAQNPIRSPEFACVQARKRLISLKGDPFLFADWERVLFLHYLISPDLLRPHLPSCLGLDLYEGKGCVSLVAGNMRKFRGSSPVSPGSVFRLIGRQSFLNLRTYVHFREEPGALFLWGWLSNPFPIALPLFKIGLPCVFANMNYDHQFETGSLQGVVNSRDNSCRFQYHASIERQVEFEPCPAGSLAEFAMERYTGFFSRGSRCRLFRAWHPAWLQNRIYPVIEGHSLISNRFPWFENARFDSANFAPGFTDVWLGRTHGLNQTSNEHHPVLSGFYEMP
jgi:uncharacterized protein YqjF (DUF2071 family)